MSKDKPAVRYIQSHIFNGIYIGFTDSLKKFHKECKRLKIKKHTVQCEARAGRVWSFYKDGEMTLIFVLNKKLIPKNAHPDGIYGLFVHESVHIWQNICEHIGEHIPGTELEAYHIQNIWHELVHLYGIYEDERKFGITPENEKEKKNV